MIRAPGDIRVGCYVDAPFVTADPLAAPAAAKPKPVGIPLRVRFQVDIEPAEPAQPAPPEDPAAHPQQSPSEQQPAHRDAEGHS